MFVPWGVIDDEVFCVTASVIYVGLLLLVRKRKEKCKWCNSVKWTSFKTVFARFFTEIPQTRITKTRVEP